MPEVLMIPPLSIRILQIFASCQAAIVVATSYLQLYFAVTVVVGVDAAAAN
jgi:hypothetical protein